MTFAMYSLYILITLSSVILWVIVMFAIIEIRAQRRGGGKLKAPLPWPPEKKDD